MEKLQAALSIGLGAACALAAGAAVFYTGVHYTGAYDGIGIDVKQPHHQPSLLSSNAFINNILLLFIFLGSHSLLARSWIKNVLSPVLSSSLYRQFYFLVSTVTLALIPYGWSPQPHLIWQLDIPALRYILYGLSVCGAVIIVVAFFSVKPLEFCGLKDPIQTLFGTSSDLGDNNQLIVDGVYGWVRHPMYTGALICLWCQSTMTQGQLLLVLTTTLYLFIAVPYLEEPDLIKLFGHKYLDYINSTGMFFPYLFTRRNKTE